jgi:hypothetical protein
MKMKTKMKTKRALDLTLYLAARDYFVWVAVYGGLLLSHGVSTWDVGFPVECNEKPTLLKTLLSPPL